MNLKKATIIGVGLMGGSLGLALRRRGGWRVAGVGRSAASLRKAKARGCIDEAFTDVQGGVSGASVVVLSLPVAKIAAMARQVRRFAGPSCLVMDIGSVKGSVVEQVAPFFPPGRGPWFVSAHPMTGSEKTGAGHAREDLFRGTTCVLTPAAGAAPRAVRSAESFWRGLGCRVARMSPRDHDRWLALTSHLPHLLAHALVLTAAGRSDGRRMSALLAAGSFRDMTRVAAADPAQWSSIFRMNSRYVKEAAGAFTRILGSLVKEDWPQAKLRRAKKWRDLCFGARAHSLSRSLSS